MKNEIKSIEKMMMKAASGETLNKMVEAAIYQKATGFTTTEIKIVENEKGIKEKITIEREEPPDLKAALAWLYNRCPERWNETQANQDTFNKVNQIINELNSIVQDE